METIALRFAENIAPSCGTIKAHQKMIDDKGWVWYGKFGSAISLNRKKIILDNKEPKVLLIHSGSTDRYWAYLEDISSDVPPLDEWPSYYHHLASKIHAWLKITKIVPAAGNVMSKCIVVSSGRCLSETSKSSMSPYFFIKFQE